MFYSEFAAYYLAFICTLIRVFQNILMLYIFINFMQYSVIFPIFYTFLYNDCKICMINFLKKYKRVSLTKLRDTLSKHNTETL